MAAMSPRAAAAIVMLLDGALVVDVLERMPYPNAASLLRQVAPRERKVVLGSLSRRRRRDFEASLAFAPDTVGANMTISIDALTTADRVADALRLKREQHDDRPDPVFVVDEQRVLVGVITPLALLRHAEDTSLADVADRDCTAVSPLLKLSYVASLDAWQHANELPVVSRSRELLGAISRRRLYAPTVAAPATNEGESLALDMLETMGHSTLDLLDSLTRPDSADGDRGVRNGR